MIKHRAILKIGMLHSSPRRWLSDPLFTKTKKGIFLTLTPKDSYAALEKLFLEEFSHRQMLDRMLSWGLRIFSVSIILIAIVALSVYEDIAKQLLLYQQFRGNFADWLSLVLMFLVIAGFALAPAIISGESSQLHDVLKSWFFHDIRRRRRLAKVVRSWKRDGDLHIYNVDTLPRNHWFWRLLAPLLLSHFQESVWHVRHDQASTLEQWLGKHDISRVQREVSPPCQVSEYVYDEQELSLLRWMGALALVAPVAQPYVTARLIRCIAPLLLTEERANQTGLLIERMSKDFGMTQLDERGRILWHGPVDVTERARNEIRVQLQEHWEEIVNLLESPISLCCLHQLLEISLPLKEQVSILERLLERIEATQQYDLILLYWLPMLGPMFSMDEEVEIRLNTGSVYQMLRPQVLDTLLTLFERNGQFNEALKLATYLQPLNPVQYGITISSLQERVGNFESAFSQLEKVTLPPETNPPQSIAVRLFQRRAWMVVSGRLAHKKNQGKQALAMLGSLLFGHSATNEPLWLWHFHNIKANYAEWDGDFASAIKQYRKCLLVPGLGDFEYGATFVNLSISQRFVFLEEPTNKESMYRSIENGARGVLFKRRVGDRDEMPVVLHNQALNILYAILHGLLPLERIDEVLVLAKEGLSIVEATHSMKRRAILTAEILLATTLAQEDTSIWKKKLQAYGPKAIDSEKEQILSLQTFCVRRFSRGFLEEFWGNKEK